MPRACPACGAQRSRPLHRRPTRTLERCVCGTVFVDPVPSAEDSAKMEAAEVSGDHPGAVATQFAAYGRDFRPDDPVVEGFERHLALLGRLTSGRRLLDVGVGTGLFLHLAQRAGWAAEGVDLTEEAAARARDEFGMHVTVGDFAGAPLAGGFDAITMLDVLEHTPDPHAFLRRAHELLAPGGVLLVAVPNHRSLAFLIVDLIGRLGGGEFADKLYVPYHLTFFTPATLASTVRACGFTVVHEGRENPHPDRYQMHPVVRLGLAAVLAISRVTGLEPRCEVAARRAS